MNAALQAKGRRTTNVPTMAVRLMARDAEVERLRAWLVRIELQVGGLRRNKKAELMRDMARNALAGEPI